jgi:hypothetical protein
MQQKMKNEDEEEKKYLVANCWLSCRGVREFNIFIDERQQQKTQKERMR